MSLRTRSFYIIALVLLLALGINTAVLIFIAYDRVRHDALSRATAYAEILLDEIGTAGAVGRNHPCVWLWRPVAGLQLRGRCC